MWGTLAPLVPGTKSCLFVMSWMFLMKLTPSLRTRLEVSETSMCGYVCSWPLSFLRVPSSLDLIWHHQSPSMFFIPGFFFFASFLEWTFLLGFLIGLRYHYCPCLLTHGLCLAPHSLTIGQVHWPLPISSHPFKLQNTGLANKQECLDNFKVDKSISRYQTFYPL